MDQTRVPVSAWILGLSGLIPFVGLSVSLVVDTGLSRPWATLALLTYGGIILAFMSGVHWGLAMRRPTHTDAERTPTSEGFTFFTYALSVVPALIGWFAVITLDPGPAMGVMAAAFAALLAYDFYVIRLGYAPPWYAKLRVPLTSVVVAALLSGAWALS